MARVKPGVIIGLAHAHWESWETSTKKAAVLDKWLRGEQYDADPDDPESRFHGRPYTPSSVSDEHTDLQTRTPTPWAGLVVKSLSQTAYVDGVRSPSSPNENLECWSTFQRNRNDARQVAVHHTAIGLSTAYGIVVPGRDPLTGDKLAKHLFRSPKKMAAFYDTDDDEWAQFAMEAEPYQARDNTLGPITETGWHVRVIDEYATHRLAVKGDGRERKDWTYIDHEPHGFALPPVARLVNRIDLDGRATGEIEPILPLLRRIDQDVFDRLIVQRYGAWKVRYIAGMAKPSTQEQANLQAIKLRVQDLLVSGDPATKFGTLDATDPESFTKLTDADLRMLSAISQTPPHHLLGLSSNLQAEALAAAESGLQRKSVDFRMNAGEFWEQMFRMSAYAQDNIEEARAFDMQVRWRDTESRSLTQAADALGKLAVQLKVPIEMLWEKIPGWTDGDSDRAKELVENGGVDALLASLEGMFDPEPAGAPSGNASADA